MNKLKSHDTVFWLFLFPTLFFFILFFLVPLINAVYFSFTDWNGISKSKNFVGFFNYIKCFSDGNFWNSLKVTFVFAVIYVFSVNILAFVFALLFDLNLKGKNIYRSILFMPNAISLVVVSFIWSIIFTDFWREVVSLLHLSFIDISWFRSGGTALAATTIALLWQSVGYYMVIYIAGLQMIDSSYYEASDIDGGSYWDKLRFITLPLMIPSLSVATFMSLVTGLKMFAIFFLMTQGGPGRSTEVMGMNIYNEAFNTGRMGYGSAKAIILFIIILLVSRIQIMLIKNREVEL